MLFFAVAFFLISITGIDGSDWFADSNYAVVIAHVVIGIVPLYYALRTKIVATKSKITICSMFYTKSIEVASIRDIRTHEYRWNQKVLEIYESGNEHPLDVKLSHFDADALRKLLTFIAESSKKTFPQEKIIR